MSSALYDTGRNGFLAGSINWVADNIKALLLNSSYSFNAANNFLSDIATAGRVWTAASLTSRTAVAGVADAADTLMSAVSGVTANAIAIYKWSGDATTSLLIAYIDTGTGLPVVPNTGDITLAWDNTAATKIFKL